MRHASAVVLALGAASSLAQTPTSPYAGQEARTIKALSPDEIAAYEEGKGMGLARAAELNHFPGPKHVLELATELALTDDQKAETQRIYDRMHAEVVRLGARVVEKEVELDRLFALREIDAENLRAAVAEIARLQGEVRAGHLLAHLEMRRLLTEAQVAAYDRLRGHGPGTGARHPHTHPSAAARAPELKS